MKFSDLNDDEKMALLLGLKNNLALEHFFAALEQTAMSRAIHAPLTDDETRAAACAEVRAIRGVKINLAETINDVERSIKKSRA
jgi:hypothetical protein